MENLLRPRVMVGGHERENNDTEEVSCLGPSKTIGKAKNAGSNLVDFEDVSWIWDTRKDYFSQLPDDILVVTLSLLTLKQAVRTSVLSSRWKNLWRFFSGTVNFDSSTSNTLPNEESIFLNRVTKALQSLPGPSLEELKICFNLNTTTYESVIDSWVYFAMKTLVKRFYLDLKFGRDTCNSYKFPLQSLGTSMSISLTSLHLKYVGVTGEVIEHLLSKCPLLEVLCVVASLCLWNLKIYGPSLKLKYLELMYNRVGNIEIAEINLISFKYYGEETSLSFKDVPCLNNASFGKSYPNYIIKSNFSNLSMVASQLETIALDAHPSFPSDLILWLYNNRPNFPTINNIKQLKLTVCSFALLPMLDGFPSLRMLSMQLDQNGFFSVLPYKRNYPCLRVLEIVGFMGCTWDVKLAMCLFNYAMLLEKIITEPSNSFKDKEGLNAARSRAQELGRLVPTGAKLLIR